MISNAVKALEMSSTSTGVYYYLPFSNQLQAVFLSYFNQLLVLFTTRQSIAHYCQYFPISNVRGYSMLLRVQK